ncbi:hypothetical protein ACQUSY_02610 [Microbacterium sp. YY-03]|uniref:hypothetical protein n=1 Tax=Microbacterium sp. YY-03 TaxID=3421636 RepID=UPI003D182698
MGLFQSRPEQPQDWGGLPAEPYNPEFDTARLDDNAITSTSVGDVLSATQSVSIAFTMKPAEPVTEAGDGE